jgi:flap endonuclease-1
MMESGIKPVYVFDGKAPELKMAEIAERREKKEAAEKALEEAKERGDDEAIKAQAGRTVRVTKEQNEQAKTLLKLMGLPIVEAPGEAEACCAGLAKAGKVYASVTEDADCLTFGTPLLVRNLLAAESAKKTIFEVNLQVALQQLDITMDQFIDFCILSGCDYCETIRGVGPSTAFKLLSEHGSIEKVIENLDPEKSPVPSRFPYKEARELFREAECVPTENLEFEWKEPDFDALRKYLVEENSFSDERVTRLMDRLKTAKGKTKQKPLDSFFKRAAPKIEDADKFDPSKKRAAPKGKAKGAPANKKARR